MRFALGGVALIVVASLWSGSAWAQWYEDETRPLQDKVIKLNREAFADVNKREWEGARQKLLDAVVVANEGGIEKHPVLARTYVNLGIVYVLGFKDRKQGVKSFHRALDIQPDIRLTKNMPATTEVDDAFAEAGGEPWPRPVVPAGDGFTEPDLPSYVNALDCPIVEQTRADQAVPVRCAVAPNLPVKKAFLFFREPIKRRFTAVEMKRTPKGWFQGRIPERVIYGQSLQFYVEGRNGAGKTIVRNGDDQSPNVIVILKR